MMKYLYLFVLILIFFSCDGNQRDVKEPNPKYSVIDVGSSVGKGRVVNLSEIASDIKYIPLETENNSLVGSYPLAFYENDRIYIRFSKIIKVFDKS
ncbi:MAG: 6-bladed beta-propeller, partial [Bacteroidales bacterium]